MADPGSITCLLARLTAGDRAALQPIWERYFRRLVGLAHHLLPGRPLGGGDSEDVALSAFASFHRGVEAGRFPHLDDRDDLWRVLLLLVRNKSINLREHEHREKRGGGRVQHFSALADSEMLSPEQALVECSDPEPSPDLAAEIADECRHLLARLDRDDLRAIALAKMEGYTNAEIADRIGRSISAVERRLALIRSIWSRGNP